MGWLAGWLGDSRVGGTRLYQHCKRRPSSPAVFQRGSSKRVLPLQQPPRPVRVVRVEPGCGFVVVVGGGGFEADGMMRVTPLDAAGCLVDQHKGQQPGRWCSVQKQYYTPPAYQLWLMERHSVRLTTVWCLCGVVWMLERSNHALQLQTQLHDKPTHKSQPPSHSHPPTHPLFAANQQSHSPI